MRRGCGPTPPRCSWGPTGSRTGRPGEKSSEMFFLSAQVNEAVTTWPPPKRAVEAGDQRLVLGAALVGVDVDLVVRRVGPTPAVALPPSCGRGRDLVVALDVDRPRGRRRGSSRPRRWVKPNVAWSASGASRSVRGAVDLRRSSRMPVVVRVVGVEPERPVADRRSATVERGRNNGRPVTPFCCSSTNDGTSR